MSKPIGKVGPCEKCAYPDCEYITARYQQCDRCDGKIKYTYSLPSSTWDDDDIARVYGRLWAKGYKP